MFWIPVFFGCLSFTSVTNGLTAVSLCKGQQTDRKLQCDVGKVILLKEVFSVKPSTARCGYQVGDVKEYDASMTKPVWNNCNMYQSCNILLPTVQNNEFLEVHYECLPRRTPYINEVSICQGSSSTGNRGLVHSPDYPAEIPSKNLQTTCTCSATFSKATAITVRVFKRFTAISGAQNLDIHWDSQKVTVSTDDPFKELKHAATKSFRVTFSSLLRDSTFWLEYNADLPIQITCSGGAPEATTSASAISTTTQVAPATSPSNGTSAAYDGCQDPIPISVLGVLLGLAVIVTILLLFRRGTVCHRCKDTSDKELGQNVRQYGLRQLLGPGTAELPGIYLNGNQPYENVIGGLTNTAFISDSPTPSRGSQILDAQFANLGDVVQGYDSVEPNTIEHIPLQRIIGGLKVQSTPSSMASSSDAGEAPLGPNEPFHFAGLDPIEHTVYNVGYVDLHQTEN